ncbi:heme biosynthesis protein HemY [Vibrio sp. OCN044]|uniref:Heme biosynthesis protein HemY n=1 Tax=Vibrio tetraodonis subsp. pristinus TaxID=2695891 RepID=A0A6L8LZ68_9VIBR|nr:heme biosynthesis HemY N-terminal domain-containing protein [Vibrio tetraodonis]MYM61421.1 heme biosynthesis protein HemY [Vibrio tetraodonis subsp. pristinus]
MFRLAFLFVVLGSGLFIGTQYAGQQGYVLISVANKTLEMSLTTLIIMAILGVVILFGLEFVIKKAFYASSLTWNYFSVRKVRKARRHTNEGIIKLLEGDFKSAEKQVTRQANHHDMPLLCYLVASEAAHGLGDKVKRDQYLDLASQQDNSELAVALTRAKQQVAEKDYAAAFDTLSELKSNQPNNQVALTLLKSIHTELKMWQPLLDSLTVLEKNKIISKEERILLNRQAQCGLLEQIAEQQGSDGVSTYWNNLPRKLKTDTHLVECFAKQLMARKSDTNAFTVIKEHLKKYPSSSLYELLPDMNLADPHPIIAFLESILRKDDSNACAHSALARFHLRKGDWADAQSHLEKALSIRSSLADYACLADALEKQNMTVAAREVSKKALTLVQA